MTAESLGDLGVEGGPLGVGQAFNAIDDDQKIGDRMGAGGEKGGGVRQGVGGGRRDLGAEDAAAFQELGEGRETGAVSGRQRKGAIQDLQGRAANGLPRVLDLRGRLGDFLGNDGLDPFRGRSMNEFKNMCRFDWRWGLVGLRLRRGQRVEGGVGCGRRGNQFLGHGGFGLLRGNLARRGRMVVSQYGLDQSGQVVQPDQVIDRRDGQAKSGEAIGHVETKAEELSVTFPEGVEDLVAWRHTEFVHCVRRASPRCGHGLETAKGRRDPLAKFLAECRGCVSVRIERSRRVFAVGRRDLGAGGRG